MKLFRALGVCVCLSLIIQNFAFAVDDRCEKALNGASISSAEAAKKQAAALAAAPNFNAYFNSVNSRMYERAFLVEILELALIAEEHLLLMGPPGNAKSMLADAVLGHIIDTSGSNSYYRIQMTPETTMSETHGPLDFKSLTATGKYERLYDEGMLHSRNVFIDEIFDGRANAMRNVLGLLAERAHAQGPRVIAGKIETVVAATNKYISEVYERAGDDSPKALLDRFAFSAFVPGEFEFVDSNIALIQNSKRTAGATPKLTFEELESVRALVRDVEIPKHVAKFLALLSYKIKGETESMEQGALKTYRDKLRNGEEAAPPYRATKYQSPRTLGKAAGILKAMIVHDWLKSGGKRELKASIADLKKLEGFFTLNGPSDSFIGEQIERSSNPHERAQLQAILQERQVFRRNYEEISNEVNASTYKYALTDLQAQLDAKLTEAEKVELGKKMMKMLFDMQAEAINDNRLSKLSAGAISRDLVRDFFETALRDLLGEKYETTVAAVLREAEEAQKAALVEAKRIEEERVLEEKRKEFERLKAEQEAERQLALRRERVQKIVQEYKLENFEVKAEQSQGSEIPATWAVTPNGEQSLVLAGNNLNIVDPSGVSNKFSTNAASPALSQILSGTYGAIKKLYAPDPDHVVFITNGNAGWTVNWKTGALTGEFTLSGANVNVRLQQSADGKTLWGFDPAMGRFMHVDLITGEKKAMSVSSVESGSLDLKSALALLTTNGNGAFNLSPDGKKALLVSDKFDHVFELDLVSGKLAHKGQTGVSDYVSMGASNDLSRVYGYKVNGGKLETIEVSTADPSKTRKMSVTAPSSVNMGTVLEDGAIALFAARHSGTGLVLVDLTEGTIISERALGTSWASFAQNLGNDTIAFGGHNGNYVFQIFKKKK